MKIFTEKRPWGEFERFTENEQSTVKIITVNKGEAFSLQFHKERKEFWQILEGKCFVTIGDTKIEAKEGDRFEIPASVNHRLEAIDDVKFLEISFGEFKEGDIVRIEDKYGRI